MHSLCTLLSECILLLLFLDITTFYNVKQKISSEMDFPKTCLIYRPDHLMAVPNYELRSGFVFEICFRTVIAFTHQLPHRDAVDCVSLLFGSYSQMLTGVLQGSYTNLSSTLGDCLFRANTWVYLSKTGKRLPCISSCWQLMRLAWVNAQLNMGFAFSGDPLCLRK